MLTVIPTAYDGHFVFFLLAQNWFFRSVCKNLLSTDEDFDGWTLIGYQSLGDFMTETMTDNCKLIRPDWYIPEGMLPFNRLLFNSILLVVSNF